MVLIWPVYKFYNQPKYMLMQYYTKKPLLTK